MHAKALPALFCRILVIAFCVFAAWRSFRTAKADWLASAGTSEGFDSALRILPDDAELVAKAAIYRNDNADPSPGTDPELVRAARLNPNNSEVRMILGLREEFSGNGGKAEEWLLQAADVDHQFKPAWALLNYYYRTNQIEKGWPIVQRILALEPLEFDPTPVFDLCWQAIDNQTADPQRILELIPAHGKKRGQYLLFLARTHRTDPALKVWPGALAAGDPTNSSDINTLTRFVDYLIEAGRISEAVTAWNELVDRRFIHSGRLNPAKGISVADPDFQSPLQSPGFAWRFNVVPGVFANRVPGLLRLEIDGDQPQSFPLLSVLAPVLAGARYHLRWKSDGSSLIAPQDPGLSFQVVQQPGETVTWCRPLLSPDPASCDFVATPEAQMVRIVLSYARAPGTTRVSGAAALSGVRLELAR